MKSIETLARVDVLCVDKTGTITENSMSVNKLVPTEEYDKENMPELSKLVGDFVKAMSSDNSTMEAMKEYFKESTGAAPVKVTPFTSATKYSGVALKRRHTFLARRSSYCGRIMIPIVRRFLPMPKEATGCWYLEVMPALWMERN